MPSSGPEVRAEFDRSAGYWDDVYAADNVKGQVYRRRQERLLSLIGDVAPPGARVADVGTGAGHLAVALARQGFSVVAVDSSAAMLDHVVANATAAGVGHMVRPVASDVHRLALPDETFDIVVANGLLPWLDRPEAAIREMVRVARPGGHVLITTDNSRGIARVIDPGWHSRGRSLIRAVRSLLLLRTAPSDQPWPTSRSAVKLEALLGACNLTVLRRSTVGFGPFTFLGRALLSRSVGMSLDRRLQRVADGSASAFRSSGLFHVVLAQKGR